MKEINELHQKITHFTPEEQKTINHAIQYSTEAHQEQTRKEGEPFITHPLNVAIILLDLEDPRVDAKTIIAALLHDTVEDTDITRTDIEQLYGVEVARLVEGVTQHKIGGKRIREDMIYYSKLYNQGKKDARIWLIKIADVLHNAQTLHVHPEKRKQELATITKEWYAPLAKKLGLTQLEKDLTSYGNKFKK